MGYSVINLKTGTQICNRGDEVFPTASTIKTAIAFDVLMSAEEGKVKWTDQVSVPCQQDRQASMWSYFFRDGVKVDLDGWTNLMITVSDNTATIVLREHLTPTSINDRLAKLGLSNTRVLWSKFPESEPKLREFRDKWGLGMTTPNEMSRFLELVYKHKAGTAAACEKLMRIMSHQYWDDYTGESVPVDVRVSSKSGAISRSRSETAIVFAPTPYIVSVYTDDQKDQQWKHDNEGDVAIRKFCKIVYKALNPKKPYSLPEGYEKFSPTGGGVED